MSKNRRTIPGWLIGVGIVTALVTPLALWLHSFRFVGPEHAISMWFHKYPYEMWVPFAVFVILTAVGIMAECVSRSSRGGFAWSGAGMGAVLAVCVWVPFHYYQDGSVKMAVLKNADVEKVEDFIPVTDKRRLPKDVATTVADTRFNRPNYGLTDGHLIQNCQGEWTWSYIQTPKRTWKRSTGGVVQISAEKAITSIDQVKQYPEPGTGEYRSFTFDFGPNMQIKDGLEFQVRKQLDGHADITEYLGVIGCDGKPSIVAPYITYKQSGEVKFPVWGGVAVLDHDGKLERVAPDQIDEHPDLLKLGHLYPEKLALLTAESYRYLRGRGNQKNVVWDRGDHKDQFDVIDTGENPQPYLLEGTDGQPYWVTMLKPHRSGSALGAMMYTNAATGTTRVWWAPEGAPFVSADKAIGIADSITVPGINTNALVPMEPRPSFSPEGDLRYIVSLANRAKTNVVIAVAIDAASGQAVGLFNYQSDADAERQLTEYLKSGELAAENRLQAGAADGGPVAPVSPDETQTTQPDGAGIGMQLTPEQMKTLLNACAKDAQCAKQVLTDDTSR